MIKTRIIKSVKKMTYLLAQRTSNLTLPIRIMATISQMNSIRANLAVRAKPTRA